MPGLMSARASSILLFFLIGALAACASSPDGSYNSVQVATAYSETGVEWKGNYGISVVELDGRADRFQWKSDASLDNALWALRHCLDYSRIFRPFGRATPPPWIDGNLAHAEVDRCIVEAKLPPAEMQTVKVTPVFDVWLGVNTPATNLASGGGNPIWASQGGTGLGVVRVIAKSPSSDLASVSTEVRQCRDLAASGGVLRTFQSTPPSEGGGGSYYQTKSVSIEAMAMRFDDCLRQNGYQLSPLRSER